MSLFYTLFDATQQLVSLRLRHHFDHKLVHTCKDGTLGPLV